MSAGEQGERGHVQALKLQRTTETLGRHVAALVLPQVGVSSVATVATLFGGPYWVDTYFPGAQLCVWDMFGETQI